MPRRSISSSRQRADHIVNDIYQWVQFNRAIINARDEPHADYRKYRRLHLLIGDSNMSPFATALKVGTTSLILTLLEQRELAGGCHSARCGAGDAGNFPRGHRPRRGGKLDDGRSALGARHSVGFLRARIANAWAAPMRRPTGFWKTGPSRSTRSASRPELLVGGVDWISKKWLLEMFREKEGLTWQDPWLQSIDLEYHNINRESGLFFALTPAEADRRIQRQCAAARGDADCRPPIRGRWAAAGRSAISSRAAQSYLINWDSIALENNRYLMMPDPFETYEAEIAAFVH